MTKIELHTQDELDLNEFSNKYQMDIEDFVYQQLIEKGLSEEEDEKAVFKMKAKFYVDVVIEVEIPESEE